MSDPYTAQVQCTFLAVVALALLTVANFLGNEKKQEREQGLQGYSGARFSPPWPFGVLG